MKRALALYLPFLSTDRLRRRDSKPLPISDCRLSINRTQPNRQLAIDNWQSSVPIVTIASQGQTVRVVHVNSAAAALRIRPGQTLAEAKAMVPQLGTYDDDPEADRRQLESLAVWAQCLSPVVHIEGDDTLIVDITGCERLFGGQANLLQTAMEGLITQGFTVRGATADTVGAAWALAHAHPEPTVIAESGRTAADLAPLPVWSLRIDDDVVAALASVGVETVGSLLHLPRSSLASRFGEGLLDRLDQALGDLLEVLTPYQPQTVLTSRIHFGAVTADRSVLTEGVHRATERFCEQLARRVAGVRQAFVTFYCPASPTSEELGRLRTARTHAVTLEINLSQPTRSAKHLMKLMRVRLDELCLPTAVESLMVWTREIDPLDDWQGELFDTGAEDERKLGDLLDRLAVRLGSSAVVRPRLCSDHQPERAFQYLPIVGDGQKPTARSAQTDAAPPGPRPLRLSPNPIEIAAISVVPDGPPIAFRFAGVQHAVADSVGPERIETGWWRGPHVQRDYYRVTTTHGRRYWLFRDRGVGRWFLHGWFD